MPNGQSPHMHNACTYIKTAAPTSNDRRTLLVEKPFCSNPENVLINSISNVGIQMINTDFDSGFKLDRYKLHSFLCENNHNASFEPSIYPGVNIKYKCKSSCLASSFVFENGPVIITGVKTYEDLYETYLFVTDLLYTNYPIYALCEEPIQEICKKLASTSSS